MAIAGSSVAHVHVVRWPWHHRVRGFKWFPKTKHCGYSSLYVLNIEVRFMA